MGVGEGGEEGREVVVGRREDRWLHAILAVPSLI